MQVYLNTADQASGDELIASILLVEDHFELRTVLTKLLERDGHVVVAQPNPIAAASFLQKNQQRFDLLITDVWMPGQNGIKFLKEFKAVFPDSPVIVMSAFGDAMTVREALQGGAFMFLTKPLDKTVFLTAVRRAIFEHRKKPPSK